MDYILFGIFLIGLFVFLYFVYKIEQKRVRSEIKYRHVLIDVLSDLRDLLKEDIHYYG